jgi:cyclopropane-fatty-acyl-phospholipid synthase
MERHGLEVHDVENWREHFRRTAEMWLDRLTAKREVAETLVGFEKTRLWLL